MLDGPPSCAPLGRPQIVGEPELVQIEFHLWVWDVGGSEASSPGQRNALRVTSDPGANDAPSEVCLADDNSPMCTRDSARLTRRIMSSFDLRFLLRLDTAA